jgi:hypothetical protein
MAIAILFGAILPSCRLAGVPALPTLQGGEGHGECPHKPPVDLQLWAAAPDSVVVGTVEDVAISVQPLLGMYGPIDDPAECGRIGPGLKVTLGDVRTLAGEPRDAVVLTFGYDIVHNDWGLWIEDDGEGRVVWRSDEALGRVASGQRWVVDLYCDPEIGRCGNLGRPLLFVEDGAVRFQQDTRYCDEPVPEGVEGMTLPELEAAIGRATGDASVIATRAEEIEVRRAGVSEVVDLNSRLRWLWASLCSPPPGSGTPECTTAGDCRDGDHCVDGYCLPMDG